MSAAVHGPVSWLLASVVGRVFGLVEQFDAALVVIDD
jgi:hypothetical protein